MSASFRIEGLQECYRAFDRMPQKGIDLTKKCFREAAKPVARQMRQGTPKRWTKLIRTKIATGTTLHGGMSVTIGMFNGHQKSGAEERDDWFKAYWANYGTLRRRDPEHVFQSKIKPRSGKRRNDIGQNAQNFYEKSTRGAEDLFLKKFQESFEKHQQELIR